MALDESFSIVTGDGTTYTVGGSTATSTTTILNRFGFSEDAAVAEFHWRFVVEATGYADLATKCNAMEAALRQQYSSLTVYFASDTQYVFEPDVNAAENASTGWDLDPLLTKVEGWPHSGRARAYDYRARVSVPPNFTDAYGPADGRRSADANLHYDVNERQVVTMRGNWTQVPGQLARPQFLSQINAYANYRLALIDPDAAWTITRREESDPQSLTNLTWSREFSQVINGRRGSTRDPIIQASGLRVTTVRGTYLRTYGMTPQTATQNYASDVQTWVDTTLAAIPTVEGGPLVIGQGCEVVTQSSPTNEQDDRLDFSWVVRELRVAQSTNTNFLDDPNIVVDSITLVIKHNPLADSPEPVAVKQVGGGVASPVVTPNAGGGSTVTRDGPVVSPNAPAPPGGPATQDGGTPTSTPVTKPIDVFARYEATFKASVENFQSYYESYVRSMLERQLAATLGVSPVVMIGDQASFDIQNCKVAAEIQAQAYPGALVGLQVQQTIADESGLHFDGVFNGVPYTFLVQPGLPDRVMVRSIAAIYLAGSGLTVSKYASKPWSPGQTGWVLFRSSVPVQTTVSGIPGLGYGTISLTKETLVEELRWVAATTGVGVQGSNPPSGAAGANQPGNAARGQTGGGANGAPSPPGGPVDVAAPVATGVGN